jgi:two-component system sensor histidine kinase KdpD
MRRNSLTGWFQLAVVAGAAVAAATGVVAGLEAALGVPNASNVYLVAVAAIAIRYGVAGASLTAVVSVLVYDFLFTEPRFALTVSTRTSGPLVLLLFVAVTVGQLAAPSAQPGRRAAREHESRRCSTTRRRDSTHDRRPARHRGSASARGRHAPVHRARDDPTNGSPGRATPPVRSSP